MTNEEAVKAIKSHCYFANLVPIGKEALDMAIKVLEQEPRWIPVSERLPEQHKEVIATDIETSDAYQSRYIGDGYWECDNGLFKNRIIAWMPLPEPYSEVGA